MLRLLHPPCAGLVEHLALERDGGQQAVEGGLAVGGHNHQLVTQVVCVAHLALQDIQEMALIVWMMQLSPRLYSGAPCLAGEHRAMLGNHCQSMSSTPRGPGALPAASL